MKVREHRGGLNASMKTVKEIEPTIEAVADYFNADKESITVEKYGDFDERIGWGAYIVCVNGNAVGFTDGDVIDGQ